MSGCQASLPVDPSHPHPRDSVPIRLPVDELDVELLLDGDEDELLDGEVLEDEPVVDELLDEPM